MMAGRRAVSVHCVSQMFYSRRNLVFSMSRKLMALCTTGRVSFATNPKRRDPCSTSRVTGPHGPRGARERRDARDVRRRAVSSAQSKVIPKLYLLSALRGLLVTRA